MRRNDAIVLSFCTGIIACCVVYIIEPPGPKYYPLESVWSLLPLGDSPGMAWYSRTVWGFAAGLAVLGVTWALAVRRVSVDGPGMPKHVIRTMTLLTLTALAVATASFVLAELPRFTAGG